MIAQFLAQSSCAKRYGLLAKKHARRKQSLPSLVQSNDAYEQAYTLTIYRFEIHRLSPYQNSHRHENYLTNLAGCSDCVSGESHKNKPLMALFALYKASCI